MLHSAGNEALQLRERDALLLLDHEHANLAPVKQAPQDVATDPKAHAGLAALERGGEQAHSRRVGATLRLVRNWR